MEFFRSLIFYLKLCSFLLSIFLQKYILTNRLTELIHIGFENYENK